MHVCTALQGTRGEEAGGGAGGDQRPPLHSTPLSSRLTRKREEGQPPALIRTLTLTLTLNQARAARRREEEEKKAKDETRQKSSEEKRKQDQKKATERVASRLREISGDPRHLRRAAKEKEEEMKRQVRKDNAEKNRNAKAWIDEINRKVAERPFLFEQASVDVAVERAKQEAHDKFDAALRKSGLADMLDPPIAS